MITANGKKLCEHCFSELPKTAKKCPYCNGKSNTEKYHTALSEGTILVGRYAVGKVLGKGGFGITYLCYDLKSDKKVAVKEYLPDSLTHRNSGQTVVSSYDDERGEAFKTGAQKFYDEASLVSRFNGNPNIISVYEFFFENNTAYFVMEYLDGTDLKHYISEKGGKISESEALFVLDKVSDALMVVHSMGVLHRDISPDNIFLCHDGNVKLIDFGAARQVVGEASKSLSVILKQGFAPPEQYQRKGKQGPWTDIYALGATIYYAAGGKIIDDAMSRFEDDSIDENGISAELLGVLIKMLAVHRENRYQSIFELKRDITELTKAATPIVIKKEPEMPKENPTPIADNADSGASEDIPAPDYSEDEKKAYKPRNITKIAGISAACIGILFALFIGIKALKKDTHDGNKTVASDVEIENTDVKIEEPEVEIEYPIVINKAYNDAFSFYEGFACVKKDDKEGFIDKSGNEVIPCIYDSTGSFFEGLANVKMSGKYGFIDKSGNVVIPCIYDIAGVFSEDLALVKKNGKYGFIDKSGSVVIPCIYDEAYSFNEGLARVKKNGKYGFIDKSGSVVIPCIYSDARSFYEGLASVKKNGKYGSIDKSGNVVIPCIYDYVSDFQEGLALVKMSGKLGFINKSGNVVIPCIYDGTWSFSEGLVFIVKNGKYGFIDKSGNEAIPCIYDWAWSFSEGLTRVQKGEKYGFIDKSGNVVIPCIYDYVSDFQEGLAAVKKDGIWSYIDTDGKEILRFEESN